MRNLFKFFLFVALLSLGISALYDYQLKHGRLADAGTNGAGKIHAGKRFEH